MSKKGHVSLRLKLLGTFVVCLVLSFVFFYFLDYLSRDWRAEYYTSYVSSKNAVHEQAELLEQKLSKLIPEQQLALLLAEASQRKPGIKVYLTDVTGRVLYHSTGTTETRLDLHRISYDTKDSLQAPTSGKLYAEIRPIIFNGQDLYLVVTGKLYAEPGVKYTFNHRLNTVIFITIFSILFYLLTRKKMRHIQAINNSVQEIANGNLQIRLPAGSQDELGALSRNINHMAQQLQEKIVREKVLEKSKIDLITNISHDLRTPLTSIIGYLTLLKEKNKQSLEETEHYIASSYNKAQQLKKLIDDLFEYTRLSSGDVKLEKQSIDLRQMLEQMVVEFEPLAERSSVTIQHEFGEDPVPVSVDPDKMARTLDNLLMNALKFSIKPATIKVTLKAEGQCVVISVGNQGQAMTEDEVSRVFERFFHATNRADPGALPRSAGLGLPIAKNIVELHGGTIWLEHKENDYQFFIKIPR